MGPSKNGDTDELLRQKEVKRATKRELRKLQRKKAALEH